MVHSRSCGGLQPSSQAQVRWTAMSAEKFVLAGRSLDTAHLPSGALRLDFK